MDRVKKEIAYWKILAVKNEFPCWKACKFLCFECNSSIYFWNDKYDVVYKFNKIHSARFVFMDMILRSMQNFHSKLTTDTKTLDSFKISTR